MKNLEDDTVFGTVFLFFILLVCFTGLYFILYSSIFFFLLKHISASYSALNPFLQCLVKNHFPVHPATLQVA